MMLTADTRILVIAAHPDDEVLGCGGTLARAQSLGATTSILFLGEGVSARFPVGQYESEEFRRQTEVRQKGAERALKILGMKDPEFRSRWCCHFDRVPMIELAKDIEAKIETFRPTLLLTHNPSEVNIDHRLTFQAVETACRPTRACTPREIYAFEIICSGNWTFDASFKPTTFVDIEDSFHKKLEAWHAYEGESRPFPFPRSDEGLTTLAKFRGMQAGVKLAEGFRLLREVI